MNPSKLRLRVFSALVCIAAMPACGESAVGPRGTGGTSTLGSGGAGGTVASGGAGGAVASGGASGSGAGASGGVAGSGAGGSGGSGGTGTSGSGGAGAIGGTVGQGGAGTGGGGTGGVSDAGVNDGAIPPDDPVNVAVVGPYTFATFTEGAKAPEYAQGLVYHPTNAKPPFAAMALSPGLTAQNTDYEVWGRVLASHGFVVLLIQPTSTGDWNDARAVDLEAALGVIKNLNTSGPLANKIDTAHIGFMGQSMGGGGTLIAANKLGNQIQAAIPMQPYAPNVRFPNITVPTLIIAAERDTVAAVSSNAFVHYNSIPATTKKIFLEGAGKDHYFSTDRFENDFEINARYAVAFLKLYLEGDTRYETYLYGAEHEAYKTGKLSRYLTP
jgi:dienelactone hydrolase